MNTRIKTERYERVYLQLKDLFRKTTDPLARMSTAAALLHHKFNYFFWTGFYLLREAELTVGPYQGSVACLVLTKNSGVCWAAINRAESIIAPDVTKFPGHIACDNRSRSEIVIPLRDPTGEIRGVFDVDSSEIDSFDETDEQGLEKIVALIYKEER